MDTTAPTRVLIADDHGAIRLGLAAIASTMVGVSVVGHAANGKDTIEQYFALRPRVLTLDLSMPVVDGLEVIRRVLARDPAARILVVTMSDRQADVVDSLRAGALGYVLKTSTADEIEAAIAAVARGVRHVPPQVAEQVAAHFTAGRLTPREMDVLAELHGGASNKSIARRLGLTEGTVKAYVRALTAKLCAGSRTGAVDVALRRGLLPRKRT